MFPSVWFISHHITVATLKVQTLSLHKVILTLHPATIDSKRSLRPTLPVPAVRDFAEADALLLLSHYPNPVRQWITSGAHVPCLGCRKDLMKIIYYV